jgi:hypothetical protein
MELEQFKWKIHKCRDDIKSSKSELKKALKQKDNIVFNENKNNEINEIRDEISTVNIELNN